MIFKECLRLLQHICMLTHTHTHTHTHTRTHAHTHTCTHTHTAPVLLQFEAVGRWYESRDARVRVLSGGSGDVEGAEGMNGESEGEEVNPLLLDPTKWKVRMSPSIFSPLLYPRPHSLPHTRTKTITQYWALVRRGIRPPLRTSGKLVSSVSVLCCVGRG